MSKTRMEGERVWVWGSTQLTGSASQFLIELKVSQEQHAARNKAVEGIEEKVWSGGAGLVSAAVLWR